MNFFIIIKNRFLLCHLHRFSFILLLGLAPQALHHHLPPGALGAAPFPGAGLPLANSNNSPLPSSTSPASGNALCSSPPLPYLPAARRQEMNSSPEGSIPTAPSPLPMASAPGDSPEALTPPPPLIFGGSVNGGGWPNSSFFNLSNSPQHFNQQQPHSVQHHQILMGQLRPAVPPFSGAFSPFQVAGNFLIFCTDICASHLSLSLLYTTG
jgi:hypothetical protein